MSVRIKNEGKRVIQFGKTEKEAFLPGQVAIVDDALAARHLKLYPKELVDIDNLKASYDVNAVKDFTATEAKPKAKKPEAEETEESETDETDAAAAAAAKTAKAIKMANAMKNGGKK